MRGSPPLPTSPFALYAGVGGAKATNPAPTMAVTLRIAVWLLLSMVHHANCASPTASTTRSVSVDIVQLWWEYGNADGTPAEGRKAMADAAARGMTYFRFAASHFWPNEMNSTYLTDELAYWSAMDALFADASDLNVSLIPSLNWQIWLWPDLAGEPLGQMISNRTSKSSALLKSYVQKFVRRYADSGVVLAWELGNEYNLQVDLDFGALNTSGVAPRLGTPSFRSKADNFSTSELAAFQVVYAGWIRAVDSAALPISTGHAVPRQGAWHLSQSYHEQQRDWSMDSVQQFEHIVRIQSSGCDLISYHYYGGEDNKRFGPATCTGNRAPCTSKTECCLGEATSAVLFHYLVTAAKKAGKQWYIGEFGTTSPADRRFTLELLSQLRQVPPMEGPVLATMWVWEFGGSQPNISISPSDGRANDQAVIEKIQAANRELGRHHS